MLCRDVCCSTFSKAWQLLQGFYADFARVADDESRHLSWCLQRLEELGYAYGDMVAHSILWEGAQASNGKLHSMSCKHYTAPILTRQ